MYEFFRDQGSIIAGFLALIAGLFAYIGAWQQVQELRDETQRKLARDGLSAIRLLDGVLSRMTDDIAELNKLLNQPQFFQPNAVAPLDWLRLISKPSLSVVWNNLGVCGTEIIAKYLLLDAEIDAFAKGQIANVNWMKNELAKFSNVLTFLRDELTRDAERCNTVLATNPEVARLKRAVLGKLWRPF